jgi:hypothetical protein
MVKRTSKKIYNCIKLESKKYKERDSPPFHARECPNIIKKGNDGNSWISLRSHNTGIYKWQKYSKELLEKRELQLIQINKETKERNKKEKEKRKKMGSKKRRSKKLS